MSLESLQYTRGSLSILDQLLLPHESTYVPIHNVVDTWNVIRSMQVRGAPLIAITAALGLAVEVEVKKNEFENIHDLKSYLIEKMHYLRISRPTAVNLFTAMDDLSALVTKVSEQSNITVLELAHTYIEAAEKIYHDDVKTNKLMGMHGANRILEIVNREKVRVLTICNTGSLATAGFGTALGVVRSLHALGRLEHIYACETRPYNQGARLTAYEIVQDELPGTLIADSMASALMSTKGVDCVIVGADRVASNGDTANKVGTYQLAIAAKYHNIPFFSAVPTTSLDLKMSSGIEIEIEERPASELTTILGKRIAPEGINVWNPGFDVTPCSLIKGIITEIGVIEASKDSLDGVIHIADYIKSYANANKSKESQLLLDKTIDAVDPIGVPSGYSRLNEEKIADYLASNSKLANFLKINHLNKSELKITEVGDGNLNYVYIIEGPSGDFLVVKQALPYIRCVGESWPLTLRRAYFEYSALTEELKLTKGKFVPEVYHFDEKKALIIMKYIEPPHLILRKTLIKNLKITTWAKDIGTFMAETLFGTSAIALDGGTLRSKITHWSQNVSMCALTEKVIFTDPYTECSFNHWTTPHLDLYAHGIRTDSTLKLAAAYYKSLFLTSTQALLHADLHTGSVMVKEDSTFIIDPEFAFYGPMGFDVGAILANLFLSFFSKSVHSIDEEYREWLLNQIELLHNTFITSFIDLWNVSNNNNNSTVEVVESSGELYKSHVYTGELYIKAQQDYLKRLWRDTLGFTGMKMIRRIVGIAHVEDLDAIIDLDVRAICEKRCLIFARTLVVTSYENNHLLEIESIKSLINFARVTSISIPSETWVN